MTPRCTHVEEYHEGIAEYKSPRYFSSRRGILRQLISRQFRIQAVVTDERFVVNQSHQILLPNPGTNIDFVVGVINSRLHSFLLVNKSALALRDDFPKLVLEDTRAFPIPSFSCQEALIQAETLELDGIVSNSDSVPRLNPSMAARLIAAAVPQIMEVRSNMKERQNRFIECVEERLFSGTQDSMSELDSLHGKTFIYSFAGDYDRGDDPVPFDQIVSVLQRNRRRIPQSSLTPGSLHALETEYRTAIDDLEPMQDRLVHFDRLVDRLVYRVYELTNDEVAIVEQPIQS